MPDNVKLYSHYGEQFEQFGREVTDTKNVYSLDPEFPLWGKCTWRNPLRCTGMFSALLVRLQSGGNLGVHLLGNGRVNGGKHRQ